MTLSIIIPVWNDAVALSACLNRLRDPTAPPAEVVVADASTSTDESARVHALATTHGARLVRCSPPSRGAQLRAGAAMATGDVLVFSHADSELTAAHLRALREAFARHPTLRAGAFRRDVAQFYPHLTRLSPLIHWWMRHLGIIYGDQSPFIVRPAFDSLGGYPDLPIMEDVAFSDRLRRRLPRSALTLLPLPVRTSPRRLERRGPLRNRIQNLVYILLWRLRLASPAQIHRWYYASGK